MRQNPNRQPGRSRRKKNNRGLYIHYIILGIILLAIVVVVARIVSIYTHDGGTVEYASQTVTETSTAPETQTQTETSMTSVPETTSPPYISPIEWIDEAVGAIHILGTNGDEPLYIMYREDDDEFYLHHDVHGEESVKGSIFADGYLDFDTADIRILYGHHMRDGSMFAVIDDYALDEEFFYDSAIHLYFPDHEEDLTPICAVVGASDANLRRISTPEDLGDFASDKTLSVGEIPDTDSFPGQLYCLVTCNYWDDDNRSYAFYYGVETAP